MPFSVRKTFEEFVKDARKVHGDKYNYDKTVYKTAHDKVIITCPDHGDFEQKASNHTNSADGCKKCWDSRRSGTNEMWISVCKAKHGDKYDYSQMQRVPADQDVTIICKKHGPFRQRLATHVRGSGCPRCFHRVSKPSIEWLDAMARIDDTHIQHGGNGGEVRLAGTRWHADGFSAELKKVYEFHGDYYHGNPRCYPADTLNKRCKRTMGELYERTCKRQKAIEDLGYAYECFWEDELNTAKTLLTLCDVRA